ncbi:Carbon monoxide dehydrogenase medium chain [Maioricimonas rarisocia]|uniref:Carbon monoxide dehydrogenase medium chain n=1 Tax=Maioricimonas rarisocia TaxID=2528026 RepID=A0A517ZC02_9PLAN|nr:xanthine dehydrogenase family protein subunit M [Maioricimonas rarisocia]QDU39970.1 Carbon monoxide dehydrogenase medium chain [Maioricimonas rarisocia]
MIDFEYEAPESLERAIAVLSEMNGRARPLAGGTDLIDHVRTGRLTPELIVDIKKIPELNAITHADDGLRLGAAVPCYRIYEDPVIRRDFAALVDACSIIGGIQIQNRASVGGNLCTSGPAADSAPALIALAATCVITGPDGTREVPVEQFFTGPGQNVLQRGELLVEMKLPTPAASSGSHYRRFIPRNEMDIAVVGVGAAVTLEEDGQTIRSARIGLGAVAPKPLIADEASQLLAGKSATDESLAEAAQAARSIVTPIDDMRGTVEFRTHVTGVLVERVLRQAIARARGEESPQS